MLSKPLLIGGAVALGALALLATSGTSHAAQQPPPGPLPPGPLPPEPAYGPPVSNGGPTVLPPVTVYGDPAAVNFASMTHDLAIAAESATQQGEGRNCTYSPTVHAFQAAYNQDPTARHPENVLGSYNNPLYSLSEDGLFGQQTATAIYYVTGDLPPSLCG